MDRDLGLSPSVSVTDSRPIAVLEVFSSPRALAYGGDDIWNAQESMINQRFPELRSNSFGGSFHVKVLQLISRLTLVALVVMLLPLVVQAQFGEPGEATLGVTGASVSGEIEFIAVEDVKHDHIVSAVRHAV